MGFPKALLPYRDQTFLDTLIGLLAARCSPVIVVLGAQAERIRAAVVQQAEFALNPDYQRGMTTSLQCGLRAVPAHSDGVLFTLVDHPAVSAATLDLLLAEPRPLLRVPRYGAKRGHPIWFSRDLIPEFLGIAEPRSARDVVADHVADTEYLNLDDPGVVIDIDDPETYEALVGQALSLPGAPR